MKVLLSLGLLAVALLSLSRRRHEDWEWPAAQPAEEPLAAARPRGRRPAGRLAVVAAFTSLVSAGAAATAGAGDQAARLLDDDVAALEEAGEIAAAREQQIAVEAVPVPEPPAQPVVETVPAEPAVAPSEPPAAEPVEEELAPPPVVATAPAPSDVVEEVTAAVSVAPTPAPAIGPTAAKPVAQKPPTKQWVVQRAVAVPAPAPEIEHEHEPEYGEPTVWLNRALPDPTPPSARLARSFARQLVAVSKRHGADWVSVLGVLRAQGERGPAPAGETELDSLASRLAGENAWRRALALSGRTAFADRAAALADLYRSVGIEALVTGFEAAQERLAERLLENEHVLVYGAGREDIAAGRIDVRIVVLLGYLAERHGSVTVSSLFSGHRKFSRPGVVSAHVYGHAVDVAAVGGTPIAGNQQPGGLTEDAVRSLLLLPAELQPQQVISLLGLGGASFPLRDHGDHIHVGF